MSLIRPKTIIVAPQPLKPLQTATIAGAGTFVVKRDPDRLSHAMIDYETIMDDQEILDCDTPRKRRRLNFLSAEEKLIRRKLKNRVAAQSARDRKKQRMSELEEALADLQEENTKLQMENSILRESSAALVQENDRLRERLEIPETSGTPVNRNSSDVRPEPAVLGTPLQQEMMTRTAFQLAAFAIAFLALLRQLSGQQQQLVKETAVESQPITDVSDIIIIADSGDWQVSGLHGTGSDVQETSSAGMVGKGSIESGSTDDPIRSDHQYHRSSSLELAECYGEEVVIEMEIPESGVSAEIPEHDVSPDSGISSEDEAGLALPEVDDLDLSAALADPDLWDHLGQIIDADQLMGLAEMPPSVFAEMPTPPPVQYLSSEVPKSDSSKIRLPSPNGFETRLPSFDTADTLSIEPWCSPSAGHDQEVASSGVGSPFVDDFLETEDYGSCRWEESFVELFPSLI